MAITSSFFAITRVIHPVYPEIPSMIYLKTMMGSFGSPLAMVDLPGMTIMQNLLFSLSNTNISRVIIVPYRKIPLTLWHRIIMVTCGWLRVAQQSYVLINEPVSLIFLCPVA